MIHLGVIVAFLTVYLREMLDAPLLAGRLSTPEIVALTFLPLVGAGLLYHAVVWRCGRHMDERGSHRAIRIAERATRLFTISTLVLHALAVMVFGWLDLIRAWIGDLVLIDELIALGLPVAAMAFAYFVMYPIDRRLREAAMYSRIERGDPVHPFPSRTRFVLLATRQHVLFMLVPLAVILAWGEGSERVFGMIGVDPEGTGASVVQMLGAVAVLALMPPVLCRLWDTVPLSPGPVREAIAQICDAHRVRVRELLLWRTGGTMVNGAVIGLLPRLRYVVVTDALVEALEPEQVAAVAAHEVGHVRRRHMPWLAASVLGSVTVIGTGLGWVANAIPLRLTEGIPLGDESVVGAFLVVTLVGVLLTLGFVSRRFEWQADAFAAQHLSGMRPGEGDMVITENAARAMSGALGRVARLNAMDPNRFTWRHGSIRTRQERLKALIGERADSIGADRLASRVKLGCLLSLIVGGVMVGVDIIFVLSASS